MSDYTPPPDVRPTPNFEYTSKQTSENQEWQKIEPTLFDAEQSTTLLDSYFLAFPNLPKEFSKLKPLKTYTFHPKRTIRIQKYEPPEAPTDEYGRLVVDPDPNLVEQQDTDYRLEKDSLPTNAVIFLTDGSKINISLETNPLPNILHRITLIRIFPNGKKETTTITVNLPRDIKMNDSMPVKALPPGEFEKAVRKAEEAQPKTE